MIQATVKKAYPMRLSSQSPMGYFFVSIPFTQTPNPLYWSYYIYYIYIFMLNLSSLLPYNRLSSWRLVSYRARGRKSVRTKKINVMDLIKYIPYIRATPQSLLKRTEGLLTIKKIMSYGVNGVSYLKERRVSKLQGTYNVLP